MRTPLCAVNARRDSLGNYPQLGIDRVGQVLGEREKAKPGPLPADRLQRATEPKRLVDLGVPELVQATERARTEGPALTNRIGDGTFK
jgi:hypothetical protein